MKKNDNQFIKLVIIYNRLMMNKPHNYAYAQNYPSKIEVLQQL